MGKSLNYQFAFYEAQSFLIAAEAIGKEMQTVLLSENAIDKGIGLQFAKYINHAFAFELLLKCIMIIEKGEYHSGHKLLSLFKQLSPQAQKEITLRFNQYNVTRRNSTYHGFFEKIELVTVLEEAGEAFVEFRYLFENKPTPKYDLDIALECLEHYISTLKPDLKRLKLRRK